MANVSTLSMSDRGRLAIRRVLIGASVLGVAIGVGALHLHLTTDPFADVHVYYDAAARLNAGLPLYDEAATDSVGLYLNPPLLAVIFRPLALLPFEVAAAVWTSLMVLAFVLALVRVGVREPVLIAAGCLAMPILWALSIGQAEPLVTLLLSFASPAAVAVAGHLKLVPWLVAVFWLGRREYRQLGIFGAALLGVGVLQLVVEPDGTLAYLELAWLRPAFEVRNISPYALHPMLWAMLVGGLGVAAFALARTRMGWPLAVALAVFAYPRLLAYQLSTLMAAFGMPRHDADGSSR